MSFTYPDRCTLSGKITESYQFNTNTGPIFGYIFRHYPSQNDAEHKLMLYTRDEDLNRKFLSDLPPPDLKPKQVSVEINSEGIGFEVLDIKIIHHKL